MEGWEKQERRKTADAGIVNLETTTKEEACFFFSFPLIVPSRFSTHDDSVAFSYSFSFKEKFMDMVTLEDIGVGLSSADTSVDNQTLIDVNEKIRNHPIEVVGHTLRGYMKDMKRIVFGK